MFRLDRYGGNSGEWTNFADGPEKLYFDFILEYWTIDHYEDKFVPYWWTLAL